MVHPRRPYQKLRHRPGHRVAVDSPAGAASVSQHRRVAELDGEIVGTASWAVLPELDNSKSPSIEIQSVSVREDLQKSGLGRRLVEAALDRVAEFKPDQIIVLTFTPPFFAKLGFIPVSKETLMYKLYKGCMNCAKYDSPFTCPEVAMAYDPRNLKRSAS